MSNFGFLKQKKEYLLFSAAAIEAEKVFVTSPAMCAIGCRKALELAVKWVYAADKALKMPYKDNLQSLIHEETFYFAVDHKTWSKLPYIVKLGNLAAHTQRAVQPSDVIVSLKSLFEFILWIDYCYGADYEERTFDEKAIPAEKVTVDTKKIKEQESLLGEKSAEIEELQKKIQAMAEEFAKAKEQNKQNRNFEAEDMSEFQTRKVYIDVDLKMMGWKFDGADADVRTEFEVEDMEGKIGQKGFVDYVLFGKDGLPLAVVEAKRTSKDPNIGRRQAQLYADCLERRFGRRPMLFMTNGFETRFWDDRSYPERKVSGIFCKDDLQRLMTRRGAAADLSEIQINNEITGRYYQKEAIKAVCEHIENKFRKHLLVMATGTGKTRTAVSLVDVLSRANYVKNVLFLADRTALVKQAKEAFNEHLPNMSLCNLCSNKDDRTARIVFSTYPTMLNAIDRERDKDDTPLFTPAHFDLIIIDESHRSIFKKYRAIFDYFDAHLLGLTATPKSDVDRNTYEVFEAEQGVPTFAYDYETAVEIDHFLVPYYNYEVKTKFTEEGIVYEDLSEEDKKKYEDDFAEDGAVPEFISSASLNKFVFNVDTVDTVLQDLMDRGIKIEGGNKIGKTIIFAANKKHAEFILQRFNALYPHYKGTFAQRVVCDDSYAQSIIDDFKVPDREPQIAVSVDMLDTGVDVPECVNLVFFKKVRSKTKFWQMIGRGTRLCKDLTCIDQIDDGEYTDKRRFIIFDYCGNFEYFSQQKEIFETKEVLTLSEAVFGRRINLIAALQESFYADENYRKWRGELVDICHGQTAALSYNLVEVRLKRQYVERYKNKAVFDFINESGKADLVKYIAPLVKPDGDDEFASRFDKFMYGLMLEAMENPNAFKQAKPAVCKVAAMLEGKSTIPQVRAKLDVIKDVQSDEFWEAKDVLKLEWARKELRDLLKFLDDGGSGKVIITNLQDPVIESLEGRTAQPGYDFADYKAKVNRYITEHSTETAIYRLTHNIKLTRIDYEELERVFTQELGSKEDYQREYEDTPFGILVRKIAKMDRESIEKAFSEFIDTQSLNRQQIAFLDKVINHIRLNGGMSSLSILWRAPFDRPNFRTTFEPKTQEAIINVIRSINNNAVPASA